MLDAAYRQKRAEVLQTNRGQHGVCETRHAARLFSELVDGLDEQIDRRRRIHLVEDLEVDDRLDLLLLLLLRLVVVPLWW